MTRPGSPQAMKRRALERWENEGGEIPAEPCFPPATTILRQMIAANAERTTPRPNTFDSSPDIMNTPPALTGTHLRTYQRIFQHPISHNLGWNDVHALFRHLGQVDAEPNGNLKVTRHGQTLILHPPRSKDVSETDEVMSLRHFLERSEALPAETHEEEAHWLLVIDHHVARIFGSTVHGTSAEEILSSHPVDDFRDAHHATEVSRDQKNPDLNGFFEPIAAALAGARKILIFGTGTGRSSEMEQFIGWSKTHHPELAGRIIGSLTVDEHHLTPDQLLAKAREFYAHAVSLNLQVTNE